MIFKSIRIIYTWLQWYLFILMEIKENEEKTFIEKDKTKKDKRFTIDIELITLRTFKYLF